MRRTTKQNNYYHRLKTSLAAYFGVDPLWMHERLLIMFALVDVTDSEYVVESTTEMTSQRFSLFIENIWQWVYENNIPLEDYLHFMYDIGSETKIKIIDRYGNQKEHS